MIYNQIEENHHQKLYLILIGNKVDTNCWNHTLIIFMVWERSEIYHRYFNCSHKNLRQIIIQYFMSVRLLNNLSIHNTIETDCYALTFGEWEEEKRKFEQKNQNKLYATLSSGMCVVCVLETIWKARFFFFLNSIFASTVRCVLLFPLHNFKRLFLFWL